MEPAAEVGVSDQQVDDRLNRFIYSLYQRARDPEAESGPGDRVISDADRIDKILHAPDLFRKNFSLIAALGRSRFSTNGEEWEQRRGLTQAEYARAGAPANRAIVSAVYAETLGRCETATPQAIQRALLAASIKIFLLAFGVETAVDTLLRLFDRARRVIKRLQYHSWLAPSAEELSALRSDVESLFEVFEREVTRLPELLHLLRELQRKGGHIEGFGALGEFLMNFFAGIETTAATLSFAIDRLGIDQRVQERLVAEVEARECPYIECFLNETLRYFPPIPFLAREAAADATVDGVAFEKGQMLLLSVVGVHHDGRFWQEPEIFDCSRAEFLRNTYNRRAFIPFLAGPRTCGGARLARMEVTEGFKAFIRRFSVRRVGDEVSFDYALALRPNSWDRVEISRRA